MKKKINFNSSEQAPSPKMNRFLNLSYGESLQAYLDIVKSSNAFNLYYWIELLLACGIASLGLILGSPATVIGAMLISPLMGPILGVGLSLASADAFLGARSLFNILLSVLFSVLFAALLVYFLPFKEMTPEILARIKPTSLDLAVAVLCGLAGCFATLKSTQGAINAIPGVAIAVSLMPPLCVVGFGLGTAGVLPQWKKIMWGGGLLFAANFAAIVVAAMLVFLLVGMTRKKLGQDVDKWQEDPTHQTPIELFLFKTKAWKKLSKIGTLQARLTVILIFLGLVFWPLHKAMLQLRSDLQMHAEKAAQVKRIQEIAKDFFQIDSQSRLEKFSAEKTKEGYQVEAHVGTIKWFDSNARQNFEKAASEKIGSPVHLLLIQIPSAVGDSDLENWEGLFSTPEKTQETTTENIDQLRDQLTEKIDSYWPSSIGTLLKKSMTLSSSQKEIAISVRLDYLSEKALSPESKEILLSGFQKTIHPQINELNLEWIPSQLESWKGTSLKKDFILNLTSKIQTIFQN